MRVSETEDRGQRGRAERMIGKIASGSEAGELQGPGKNRACSSLWGRGNHVTIMEPAIAWIVI